MQTEEDKYYKIYWPEYRKWIGRRKNGKLFWKEHKGGACEFPGGPELDKKLEENPEYEAIECKPTKLKPLYPTLERMARRKRNAD